MRLAQAAQRVVRNDQLLLFALALIVGVAAGYGALAFRLLTALIQLVFFGHASEFVASHARVLPWWQVLGAPVLGGLLIGLFAATVMPGRRPQAVADVMEASALRQGRMSLNAGLGAAFMSAASIGCGASVGREGPIVHLGASLASAVARKLHLSPSFSRTLLGCGVAAAIGSAFNAPIAGVFFALEVVIGHYGLSAFSPVVISSVIGTMITRIHLGADAAFQLPPQVITSFWELPAFILLGLVAALVALALMRAVAVVQWVHDWLNVPPQIRPALAGLAVGLIALVLPEVLGVGYEATDRALRVGYELQFLIMLAIAKATATAICLGSGFGGGVFSPSLVLGALTGASFGIVAGSIFPDLGSSPSVYAILGMGAVAACVLGAPISTVIMIFELTTDYEVTFALMVAVAVASVTSYQIWPFSFFTWQLATRGIQLGRRDQAVMRATKVQSVLRRQVVRVGLAATLDELKALFVQRHLPIFVIDGDDRLVGTIHFEDLADAAFDPERAGQVITARDLVHRIPLALTPEDDLETALRLAEMNDEEHMPVVDNGKDMRVIGEVRQADLVLAYNRALLQTREAERGT
ncbi:MAG TPA: chloride channel protein [Geminicoccaceae bacterium]